MNGQWVDLDLAWDTKLENGVRVIGIWAERNIISEEGPYDSLDGWLEKRLGRRTVIKDRESFFQFVNCQMDKIRHVAELAEKAGVRVWTDAQVKNSLKNWEIIAGYPFGTTVVRQDLDDS